ncbi:LacI family transcriptional regulator [Terrimicrobium sacchariphilum]|uniref:LacI family transcriptional regulator n=1 Tax=Terrimicrobium sacchariphilum TaxID=690879 RepID=A0A146GBG7_TERSA|nr:LacI family DNA-binding transcriptional regulator [Terrimicrobium sacchariphilum]GAT34711.1 LacI family transcriptional regulator [Terrimicrobium sacchariphilum]
MNITAIAKASGVSVATVSRILNHEDGVSDEVRRKTMEVIERNGYRPRGNVRRNTRLGVVVRSDAPSFDSFFSRVFTGVSAYAFEAGIETSLIYFSPKQVGESVSLAEILRKKRCNGAVMISPAEADDVESMKAARIPLVLVTSRREEKSVGYIDCNCFQGAYEQTRYLIRLGHRRIGFLCGQLDGNVDHQERLAGFKKAMEEAEIKLPSGLIVEHDASGLSEFAGYKQAGWLLDRDPSVTAIFATNDLMACGAICRCAEMGLKVPEDISVVGYDDNPGSRFYNPPLTTVRQPLRRMGYDAARAVDLKLKGKSEELPTQVLENELIVRQSCAPPSR